MELKTKGKEKRRQCRKKKRREGKKREGIT